MKQIKTIYKQEAETFDELVNAALAEGWELSRRTFDDRGFLAELEREEITEAERCCENCAHFQKGPAADPCFNCSDDADKWEAAEP